MRESDVDSALDILTRALFKETDADMAAATAEDKKAPKKKKATRGGGGSDDDDDDADEDAPGGDGHDVDGGKVDGAAGAGPQQPASPSGGTDNGTDKENEVGRPRAAKGRKAATRDSPLEEEGDADADEAVDEAELPDWRTLPSYMFDAVVAACAELNARERETEHPLARVFATLTDELERRGQPPATMAMLEVRTEPTHVSLCTSTLGRGGASSRAFVPAASSFPPPLPLPSTSLLRMGAILRVPVLGAGRAAERSHGGQAVPRGGCGVHSPLKTPCGSRRTLLCTHAGCPATGAGVSHQVPSPPGPELHTCPVGGGHPSPAASWQVAPSI